MEILRRLGVAQGLREVGMSAEYFLRKAFSVQAADDDVDQKVSRKTSLSMCCSVPGYRMGDDY